MTSPSKNPSSDYLAHYQAAKKSLNPEQRVAVETIEGPVLVIAGPGTGKTQVLSLRIAEILEKQTDIAPGNILCLTYTNAGVIAMRKRLISFIGAEAHKVQIHTFHSFCNQVIQENTELFGVREAESIGELEQYELLENILDSLPAKHPLFHKSSYHEIKNLLSLFATIKQENWQVTEIKSVVEEYLADLPQRDEFQYKRKYKEFAAGDPNPNLIQAATEKMVRLLAAVELFPEYQQRMRANQWYDFQDMILWVIEAFVNKPALLASYQERFQYLLVDEFQDTNGAQKQIIDLLSQYWELPNIFVVGDDDQSIYRFQGANLRNIMDFYEHYKANAAVVTIEKNYRSTPAILEVAEHIIEKNSERLVREIPDLQKHLVAQNPNYMQSTVQPHLIRYYNSAHEELGIMEQLKKLQTENIPLSEVAVIYQNHAQVANILRLCELEKIPVRVKETEDILALPIITQLLELLRYFCDEATHPFTREDILFRALYFDCINLAPRDIGLLALWRRQERDTRFLKNILRDSETLATIDGIKESEQLLAVGNLFSALEQDFINLPLVRFLEELINKSGILAHVTKQAHQAFLLRALTTFRTFVREAAQKKPDMSATSLLDRVERMKRHGISIPIQRIAYEQDGVNFVTAHSAKGLEFEYVFLIGVDKKIWDSKRSDGGFSFPDTLTRSNSGDFFEEKRRLFFVALTRAKQFLQVSFAEKNEAGKELDVSQFVTELAEKLPTENRQSSAEAIDTYQISLFYSAPQITPPLVEREFLEHLLANYRMSATHLNTYLACPLTFYFQQLLRIPGAPSPHAAFGTAVHIALEKEFQQAKRNGSYGTAASLLTFFREALTRQRYAFTEVEFQKFLAHGEEVLAGYFRSFLADKSVTPTFSEYSINTELSGVAVTGQMDKIEILSDGSARITDYKTGNPSNPWTSKKLERPSDKNNFLGGDYWRQMVFYSLLLENDPSKKWQLGECVIDFVEPQKDGAYLRKTFIITKEDQQLVREQIAQSFERILKMDFSGCHEETCVWCNLM